MKCGDCKHWNPIVQGATYNDIFKEFMTFGKVIGDCEYHVSIRYPFFSNEECKCKARILTEAEK